MHDVLQIGRGAGDPLDPRGRAAVGRVGRLHDPDVGVARVLHVGHEPQAVLRQQHAVGVEREHVVGIGHLEVERAAAHGEVDQAGSGGAEPVAPAHETDVAVEVHGLVGLVRERREALALEARDVGPEDPDEAPVEPPDAGDADVRVGRDGLAERARDPGQVGDQAVQDLVQEELVDVVDDLLGGRELAQPGGRVVVGGGQPLDVASR